MPTPPAHRVILILTLILFVSAGEASTAAPPRSLSFQVETPNPTSSHPAPVASTPSSASSAETQVETSNLARFIRLMLHYSDLNKKPLLEGEPVKVCLTERTNKKYQISILDETTIKTHPVEVDIKRVAREIDTSCDVAIFLKNETRGIKLKELYKSGVLTISDQFDFARESGVIEISFVRERIAFYFKRTRLKSTNIQPNSKFLRMASEVY